ncbi:MAG: 4-demethylwyosine synthase TYW1 [Candidatus Aenigmarchaeota archaeon]|nr:4-demethylwyosine synthase TYW1 [Candidatus Aenigmarchaeota archaeon]
MLPDKTKKEFEKKHYGLFGEAGVEICEWTKKCLKGEGACYKNKFYGVNTHRCVQFSPLVAVCNQNCVFCWRPNEEMQKDMESKVEEPEKIVEGLLPIRKKLLMGFKGNPAVSKEVFEEAVNPDHYAISLSGEPTIYPKIISLIDNLCKTARTVFLVTNGSNPEVLENLKPHKNFQLYISCNAPNEEMFLKICRPSKKGAWKRFLGSLDAMSNFRGRRVLRMTFIRGLNDDPKFLPDYQKLIEGSGADFVEVKSFMSIGYSRKRLSYDKMLSFRETQDIAKKLLDGIDYRYEDEQPISRIVLLKNKKSKVNNHFK